MMFNKILIANRGEIACRIIRTAQRLGIKTAVIYSAVEKNSLAVQQADEAVEVVASSPRASYLDMDQIIHVATELGAQAIHPGYGFLSENSEFAKKCKTAGIVFIGPSPAAMDLMAEKDQAKQFAQKHQVPIIPGYMGEDQSINALAAAAQKIGFPILIKAVAGDGGKAMHIAYTATELEEVLPGVQREAEKSFANSAIMLEKYLPHARHIEVQVFGDQLGHYVHLFDRDCSLQRRYQKILEEAPAPSLSLSLREGLWKSALTLAKAIQYQGAGTVEFLVDDQDYYFLEMNTRLQVEHPVTEYITGVDLVEWQLRVAAGEPLPLEQKAILATGHAVEVRICAEDPEHDFLPATGTIKQLIWPKHVRIESGVEEGETITPYFDSLIAKLIVHADLREQAFYQLEHALSHTAIIGVTNNIGFLQRIAHQPDITQQVIHTQILAELTNVIKSPELELWLLCAAVCQATQISETFTSPWGDKGWRLNANSRLTYYFRLQAEQYKISVERQADNNLHIQINDKDFVVHILEGYASQYAIKINEKIIHFHCYTQDKQLYLITEHDRAVVDLQWLDVDQSALQENTNTALQALMPGTVIQVFVTPEQAVQTGDRLVTLEAMKMEHTIRAPYDGIIGKLYCQPGEVVEAGATLVDLYRTS